MVDLQPEGLSDDLQTYDFMNLLFFINSVFKFQNSGNSLLRDANHGKSMISTASNSNITSPRWFADRTTKWPQSPVKTDVRRLPKLPPLTYSLMLKIHMYMNSEEWVKSLLASKITQAENIWSDHWSEHLSWDNLDGWSGLVVPLVIILTTYGLDEITERFAHKMLPVSVRNRVKMTRWQSGSS